jgi:hypothetical protein
MGTHNHNVNYGLVMDFYDLVVNIYEIDLLVGTHSFQFLTINIHWMIVDEKCGPPMAQI